MLVTGLLSSQGWLEQFWRRVGPDIAKGRSWNVSPKSDYYCCKYTLPSPMGDLPTRPPPSTTNSQWKVLKVHVCISMILWKRIAYCCPTSNVSNLQPVLFIWLLAKFSNWSKKTNLWLETQHGISELTDQLVAVLLVLMLRCMTVWRAYH